MDPRDKPWQAPGLVPRNETLYVGLAASRVLPREVVLEALRSAVGLATGWIGVEVTWSTFFAVDEDGTGNPRADDQRPGLDWDFLATKPGTPDSVTLTGVCTELAAHPTHPGHEVAIVHANFPTWVEHNGGLVGRMSVSLSVQRWAMYGSGEQLPWFTEKLDRWVVEAVPLLGAEVGFAVLDYINGRSANSPWERRAYVPATRSERVWGYGWAEPAPGVGRGRGAPRGGAAAGAPDRPGPGRRAGHGRRGRGAR